MTAQEPAAPSPLDGLITAEAALVTLAGAIRDAGPPIGLTEADETFLRAVQCADEAHYHLLQALGATPAADAFAIPGGVLAARGPALRLLAEVKAITLGAQMALARSLVVVDGAEPPLAETVFAMGAIEGGHAVLLRALLGGQPAADRAFLPWRFADPADGLAALAESGLLDDAPDAVPFPGPLPRICRGLSGLVPQTTEEALAWETT
jgi:hypothetical protein